MTRQARIGSSLHDGCEHAADHRRWTRREFLFGLGAAASSAFVLHGTPMRAFGQSPLLHSLAGIETDRVLVLIQLNGGNDGLNTVVPVDDDSYYQRRPTLAIAKSATLPVSDLVGLHPSLGPVSSLFAEGEMSILHSVGYPSPNLSHFRSTDIWVAGADPDEVEPTGWLGRTLDDSYPDYSTAPPDHPLAVQIGGGSSTLFQGPGGNMGMSLISTDLFERIVEGGTLYDSAAVPDTSYGSEISFLRTVANNAFRYADVIQEAADGVQNSVEYPGGNALASNLSLVARLIKGRLRSRIYLVSLSGFDTHANQLGAHSALLSDLAEAVKAFRDDLAADELSENVLVMTFSEFGRRVQQNGSNGTDHGTAAPLFLFGGGVNGGLYGGPPRLDDLDQTGNLKYEIDFRSVYSTILADWFGLAPESVDSILGGSFSSLGFVADPTTVGVERPEVPAAVLLHQNYPNPFNPTTVISYRLDRSSAVRLDVFDVNGRLVSTLVNGTQRAGEHEVRFDAGRLSSGAYVYRLETPAGVQSRTMVLVR